MQNSKFYKKFFSLVFIALLTIVGLWAYSNKWDLYDRWVSRSYEASVDSTEVLDQLNLTSRGELVYKASLTRVDGKDDFRKECPTDKYEGANVLGCYSGRKIYVLKVDEPKLAGVEEVTAAHELLHAKFERMSSKQKKELAGLLEELSIRVSDKEVVDLITNYKKELGTGQGLDNEMFAVYGTQLTDVGAELEKVYSDYFKDRASIVAKYQSYSAEFKKINDQVASYDTRLAELKVQSDKLNSELTTLNSELNQDKTTLDNLRSSGDNEEYYQAALAYNEQVNTYNQKVKELRDVVEEYNQLVEARNNLALSAKSLADKLNANVDER